MSESFLAAMRARQFDQQPGAPLSLSTSFSPTDAVLSSPELMSEIFGYIRSLMSEVIERAATECYAPGKVILEKKVVTLTDKEEFGIL